MKMLIVEDESELALALQSHLKSEGHLCEIASSYALAEEKIGVYAYDCALVDLTLPDGNGLKLVEELRTNHPKTSIIIISAKHSLEDKLKGFDLGADDYLPKPFHFSELNARIRSVLRRSHFNNEDILTFQEISVNLRDGKAWVNGYLLVLTKKEYDLLVFFFSNIDRLVSKEALAEHLWGDYMDASDSFDFIYSHIKNLRKKITEHGGGDYIHTIYGMGYRFGLK